MKKAIPYLVVAILTVATYISDLEEPQVNIMTDNTKVCFIDVGQGDSSLIITGDQAILIDGGRNADEENVSEFIKEQGIKSIDLIIATHTHEDHIGGLDAVIENFAVSQILMPDVPYNTITYADVITAANENGTQIIYPEYKDVYEFDSGLKLTLLTPPQSFESSDTNDDSIVCRVDIGETSILYTGDMEKALENAIMPQVTNVDILKVGHHGSNTSSTEGFLDKANPQLAIISCGIDNRYNHPSQEVLDRFSTRNIQVRRTDIEGDIILEFENQQNQVAPEMDNVA